MSALLSEHAVITVDSRRSNIMEMEHVHAHPTVTHRLSRSALASGWHFTWHLLTMIVAMLVGMGLFGLATMLLGMPPGDNTLLGGYAYMGFAMALSMVAVMHWMGHAWTDCGEMCAAMLAPFFALVLPVALGVRLIPGLTSQSLLIPAHSAMILGMVLLMVYRFDRYAHGHGAHHHGTPAPRAGGAAYRP